MLLKLLLDISTNLVDVVRICFGDKNNDQNILHVFLQQQILLKTIFLVLIVSQCIIILQNCFIFIL